MGIKVIWEGWSDKGFEDDWAKEATLVLQDANENIILTKSDPTLSEVCEISDPIEDEEEGVEESGIRSAAVVHLSVVHRLYVLMISYSDTDCSAPENKIRFYQFP